MLHEIQTFRPLEAAKVKDLEDLEYPLLGSWKIDGIRSLQTEIGPVLKSITPVPSLHIRRMLAELPHGFDGEIEAISESGAPLGIRATQSAVMAEDGAPLFRYHIFDDFSCDEAFEDRAADLADIEDLPPWAQIVRQFWLYNAEEAQKAFLAALAAGREGLVLRSPDAPYLLRCSTLRDQAMLKVKPWDDAEGEILDTLTDAHGGVAAIIVNSPLWPRSFSIPILGADRARLAKRSLVGKLAKFRYVATGGYDVPRHTVFLTLRDRRDMSIL